MTRFIRRHTYDRKEKTCHGWRPDTGLPETSGSGMLASQPMETAESDHLHARVQRLIAENRRGNSASESFDALACDLARFQARNIECIAKRFAAAGIDAEKIERAAQI